MGVVLDVYTYSVNLFFYIEKYLSDPTNLLKRKNPRDDNIHKSSQIEYNPLLDLEFSVSYSVFNFLLLVSNSYQMNITC